MVSQPVRHWHFVNGNVKWLLKNNQAERKLKALMVKRAGKGTPMRVLKTAKTSASKLKSKHSLLNMKAGFPKSKSKKK